MIHMRDKLKLSFRLGYGYGKEIQTRPATVKQSIEYLDRICTDKYGRSIREMIGEKEEPEPVRIRRRGKPHPEDMFFSVPDKARRVMRRRRDV